MTKSPRMYLQKRGLINNKHNKDQVQLYATYKRHMKKINYDLRWKKYASER